MVFIPLLMGKCVMKTGHEGRLEGALAQTGQSQAHPEVQPVVVNRRLTMNMILLIFRLTVNQHN